MAKLYVFGIGGTGSRVIKALAMLLASGVKLSNGFDTVVPIIIDPDTANGDLNKTGDILTKYQNIFKEVGTNNNFFGTRISTLPQLTDGNVSNLSDNFKFNVDGSGQKFGESIDYNGLDNENKAFIDLLFSKENIEADMTVGFKGNPNIGSIVLNKIVDSVEYKEFTNSFNEGDAIFIISSIFGGTGASGFPLLLKNLRQEDPSVINSNIISKSRIGAITYLPYFKVSEPDDGQKTIDSSTFFSKAKAALSYYQHAIFDNMSLDAFYHLGDHSNNNMDYAEGKGQQKNDAHFLEMAGALAIVDYVDSISNLNHTIKEFGIEEDGKKLVYENLGVDTKKKISLPLSKLSLLQRFLEKSMNQLLNSRGDFSNEAITKEFYTSDFYKDNFSKFMNYFNDWLNEMSNNDIAFAPFHSNQDHAKIMDYIIGKEPKKNFFGKSNSKGDIIIKQLNNLAHKEIYKNEDTPSMFLKMFDEVIEEQVSNLLN
ncbi:hypothetical protein [uncultured Dokdonia sp.]|uniref:hypothetical protein n=1 Tax=uncultured Dokdonia sp. TaxID=575653 RepID=UPI002606A904|nr:hypothetical protein [uncultured Dokdonia sp.]